MASGAEQSNRDGGGRNEFGWYFEASSTVGTRNDGVEVEERTRTGRERRKRRSYGLSVHRMMTRPAMPATAARLPANSCRGAAPVYVAGAAPEVAAGATPVGA